MVDNEKAQVRKLLSPNREPSGGWRYKPPQAPTLPPADEIEVLKKLFTVKHPTIGDPGSGATAIVPSREIRDRMVASELIKLWGSPRFRETKTGGAVYIEASIDWAGMAVLVWVLGGVEITVLDHEPWSKGGPMDDPAPSLRKGRYPGLTEVLLPNGRKYLVYGGSRFWRAPIGERVRLVTAPANEPGNGWLEPLDGGARP